MCSKTVVLAKIVPKCHILEGTFVQPHVFAIVNGHGTKYVKTDE